MGHASVRGPRRTWFAIGATLVILAIAGLAGCTASGSGSPSGGGASSTAAEPASSSPEPSPSESPTPSDSLAAFADTCQRDVEQVASGKLQYNPRLTGRPGQPQTYDAAIVLTGAQPTPTAIITGPNPTSSSISVECRVGARLLPVGDGIAVAHDPDADPGGWLYEQFAATPAGELQWHWTVTPHKLGTQRLTLQLRPAVAGATGGPIISSAVLGFTTTVTVKGTAVQRAANTAKGLAAGWEVAIGILAAVLTATTALLVASAKFRDALRSLLSRGPQPTAGPNTSSEGRRPRRSARRRRE